MILKEASMLYTIAPLPHPLGDLLLLSDDGNTLTGLYFADQPHAPTREATWKHEPNAKIFVSAIAQLNEFARGQRTTFTIPYRFTQGTPFQHDIWSLLATVPYGTTSSYMRLAVTLMSHRAVRAIGAAVGKNPLSIIIPCHRIIGTRGDLTGYAGGLERKKALLDLEQRHTP